MGGNFTVQNKIRPGAYINFKSNSGNLDLMSSRGTVVIPLELSWGAEKQVIEVNKDTDIFKTFGHYITDSEMLLIKEAMKRAIKILVYRVNTGAKATGTDETLKVTAKYSGKRGNDIKVTIIEDADNEGYFYINTILEDKVVDTQYINKVADIKANEYVEFEVVGDAIAANEAGIVLSAGANGEVTNVNYTEDFLNAITPYEFNTIALPVDTLEIKQAVCNYTKRQRDDEGKKIQAVVADYNTADHEGIISVKNGVVLEDGTTLTNVQATVYVAGLTAGSAVNKSNTYEIYDEAIAVPTEDKYTNSQIEEYLQAGHIVFVEKKEKVVIEQDINTLHTFTLEKTKEFSKNRVMRCLDAIGTDVKEIFENYFIGKISNNEDGRNLFKAQLIKYLNSLTQLEAIQNFDASTDLEVKAGESIDSVAVELYVQPVDSMEKLYMNVYVEGGNS